MIHIKRAYESPEPSDGIRILVDRLWPRGLRKDAAKLDEWLKQLAPSDALRKWFAHDPERFTEFRQRYKKELESPAARELLLGVARRAGRETVTLVYAANDAEHNNAVVLAQEIQRRLSRRASTGRTSSRRASPRPTSTRRAATRRKSTRDGGDRG